MAKLTSDANGRVSSRGRVSSCRRPALSGIPAAIAARSAASGRVPGRPTFALEDRSGSGRLLFVATIGGEQTGRVEVRHRRRCASRLRDGPRLGRAGRGRRASSRCAPDVGPGSVEPRAAGYVVLKGSFRFSRPSARFAVEQSPGAWDGELFALFLHSEDPGERVEPRGFLDLVAERRADEPVPLRGLRWLGLRRGHAP